jgi:hypothetical protein
MISEQEGRQPASRAVGDEGMIRNSRGLAAQARR